MSNKAARLGEVDPDSAPVSLQKRQVLRFERRVMRKEEMHYAAAIGDNREPAFLDQGDHAFHRLHGVVDKSAAVPTYDERRTDGKGLTAERSNQWREFGSSAGAHRGFRSRVSGSSTLPIRARKSGK